MPIKKILVDLSNSIKDDSYPILIGSGVICRGAGAGPGGGIADFLKSSGIKDRGRAFVITCGTVERLYGSVLRDFLEGAGVNTVFFTLPDGETTKSLKYLSYLYDGLVEKRVERSDFIIAFGGGVVGDIAGYAAATYLRGINFIQIPTTLLADVDSSVGGKTGIDHAGGKNLIGAFYQPKAVLIDADFLNSLDKRELANGFSEVIKYGAVLDKNFFSYLEHNYKSILSYDKNSLAHIIEKSCLIKAGVVNKDEKEAGLRSVLNFGHSLGHAVETLYNYENIKHGEAVAIGMVFAAMISKELGASSDESVNRVKTIIENSGLPAEIPAFTPEQFINAMKSDKKVDDKSIKFVLIKEIGRFEFKMLDFGYIYNFLNKILK